MTTLTLEEMERRSHPEPNTGCWLWMGATYNKGYGSVREKGGAGKLRGAHRVMYEICHGPIPDGHVVMHTCDNPPCVNPAHLRVGTHRSNCDDKMTKGRGGHLRGEQVSRSVLDEAAVREMRALSRPVPLVQREGLARKYGVALITIENALYGQTWRHVK